MSENVIPIEANQPHTTGPAQCRSCRRSWVAVVLTAANPWLLECPGCGLMHGHIPAALPDSPYQAKVWAEEMWRYLTWGVMPGAGAIVLRESPSATDGCAGFAGTESTDGASILTVDPSRWTTSSRSDSAGATATTISEQHTSGVTTPVGRGGSDGR